VGVPWVYIFQHLRRSRFARQIMPEFRGNIGIRPSGIRSARRDRRRGYWQLKPRMTPELRRSSRDHESNSFDDQRSMIHSYHSRNLLGFVLGRDRKVSNPTKMVCDAVCDLSLAAVLIS
jgi:hypothetical protein